MEQIDKSPFCRPMTIHLVLGRLISFLQITRPLLQRLSMNMELDWIESSLSAIGWTSKQQILGYVFKTIYNVVWNKILRIPWLFIKRKPGYFIHKNRFSNKLSRLQKTKKQLFMVQVFENNFDNGSSFILVI